MFMFFIIIVYNHDCHGFVMRERNVIGVAIVRSKFSPASLVQILLHILAS